MPDTVSIHTQAQLTLFKLSAFGKARAFVYNIFDATDLKIQNL